MKYNLNRKTSTVVLCGVLIRKHPIFLLSILLKQVSKEKLTSGIPALSAVHLHGGGGSAFPRQLEIKFTTHSVL